MSRDYIAQVEGEYRIVGTRVSLDSVVYAWLSGLSPESIVDSYPVLTLEEVHGALAYYLGHHDEVDEYLRQAETDFDALRQQLSQKLRESRPQLYQKLLSHKQQKTTPSS